MERFNSKLWDLHQNLKKRRVSEIEEWSSKQESNHKNYELATYELIEAQEKEINQLRDQLLLKEEDYAKCHVLLLEEKRKNKELTEEKEKLHALLLTRKHCDNESGHNSNGKLYSLNGTPEIISRVEPNESPQKLITGASVSQDEAQTATLVSANHHQEERIVPPCCTKVLESGKGSVNDFLTCLYQTMLESLVGMQFSVQNETDQPCVLAVHPSSGYSFCLSWKRNIDGGGEWLYHVLSLGTIEQVARDWMKEDIMFSPTMCRFFFGKVSQIIGL